MAKYNRNRYGSIILQDENGNSFTITKKEQAEIKRLTKNANQRRLDKGHAYYDMIKGQRNMQGVSYQAYMDLLNRKGFITEKYSANMSQFKSKEEVKDYLKELKTVTKRGYGNKRLENIRKSMKERVLKNYGEGGKLITDKIDKLSNDQLLSIYLHNDDIVQELYGSPEISTDELHYLATKTLSDINYFLEGTKKTYKPKTWSKYKK